MAKPDTPEPVLVPPISTEEIGQILEDEYGSQGNTGNEAIDYFYLQIRKRNVKYLNPEQASMILHRSILALNNDQDLSWRKVHPGRHWQALFFGEFPKQGSETEREREDRLNKKVRTVLKEELEEKLQGMYRKYCKEEDIQPDEENLPKVSIMITRACKYTGPDESFMDYM